MGFLDRIVKALTGSGSAGPARSSGADYLVYLLCNHCGEPLRVRVDLRNELSLADDGEGYVVRKGVVGSGRRRCFQTIEVTLHFDARRQPSDRQVAGGRFITEAEYDTAAAAWPPPEEQEDHA